MPRGEINPKGIADELGLRLALICGPVEGDPYSDAQLERAWEVWGEELTESLRGHEKPGLRPWGWWEFVAGREEPEDYAEAVAYLAERGELTEAERAKLADRGR